MGNVHSLDRETGVRKWSSGVMEGRSDGVME
jgi:hypothetical protein